MEDEEDISQRRARINADLSSCRSDQLVQESDNVAHLEFKVPAKRSGERMRRWSVVEDDTSVPNRGKRASLKKMTSFIGMRPRITQGTQKLKWFPTLVTCSNCRCVARTRIVATTNSQTHLIALLFLPLGLCFIPYMFSTFKSVRHYCSVCHVYLGACPNCSQFRRTERKNQSERPQTITMPDLNTVDM